MGLGSSPKIRRQRSITVGLLALILIGVASLVLIHVNKPMPKTILSQQRYTRSIQEGLNWIDQSHNQISPYQWLLIDYLQRQYGLSKQFSAADMVFNTFSDQQTKLEFGAYYRVIRPNDLVGSLPTGLSPMDTMMLGAANCDHIPLPNNFLQLIRENLATGGYGLTHVVFSLERMKENNCTLWSGTQGKQIRETVAVKMADLIKNPASSTDLRYEAIAFLLAMGRHDLIQKQWIDQIINEQKSNGCWGGRMGSSCSDHTTVLALWSLLQYSRPSVHIIPMIRRPQ